MTMKKRIPSDMKVEGNLEVTSLTIPNVPDALLVTDGQGNVSADASIDLTELDYLDGLDGNVQTQLDNKIDIVTIGGTTLTKSISGHTVTAAMTSTQAFAASGFTSDPQLIDESEGVTATIQYIAGEQ